MKDRGLSIHMGKRYPEITPIMPRVKPIAVAQKPRKPAPRLQFKPDAARRHVGNACGFDIIYTIHPFEDRYVYFLYRGGVPVDYRDTESEAYALTARLTRHWRSADPCPF